MEKKNLRNLLIGVSAVAGILCIGKEPVKAFDCCQLFDKGSTSKPITLTSNITGTIQSKGSNLCKKNCGQKTANLYCDSGWYNSSTTLSKVSECAAEEPAANEPASGGKKHKKHKKKKGTGAAGTPPADTTPGDETPADTTPGDETPGGDEPAAGNDTAGGGQAVTCPGTTKKEKKLCNHAKTKCTGSSNPNCETDYVGCSSQGNSQENQASINACRLKAISG